MAITIEKLVVELKWDTNRTELAKARTDADKLKAASKQLEEEQRKSVRTTHKLREELQDLRVAAKAGIITQADFKKKTAAARLALTDESLAAKRTSMALRELNTASRAAAKEAAANARAQDKAAAAMDRAARAAARTRDRTARASARADAAPRLAEMRAEARARIAKANKPGALAKRMANAPGAAAVAGGVVVGNMISGAARSAVDGIGDALVGSAAKAIAFESAMADVAKVVDGLKGPTGETTAAYHALTDELKTLSTRIAVTPEGLAEMAAAAGQAGIKGNELTRFVEDAAKTMVAFDISSEEAGNGLAKLRANLALDQDQVVSLAGTMNVLSNSMASTAAEVLDATLRVGAVGKAANISGQEVAGMASAMIASGATSEIAATATKNFILSMSAGIAATRRQREAFARLGLDSKDVAKQFTGTAEQRLAISRKVIESMGNLSKADQAATSMQLFGRESLGPIASLTTDLKKFDDAMRLATDTQAAAASVQKEYEVRSATTENTLKLLMNRVSVVAIEIGEGMLPAIREVAASMGEWLGVARASGKGIGETLGNAIKRVWEYLRGLIGPADELPGKIEKIIEKAATFASAVMKVVDVVVTLVDKIGGVGTSLLVLAAAGGPFAAAAVAGVLAGEAVAKAWMRTKLSIVDVANAMRVDAMGKALEQIDKGGKEVDQASRDRERRAYEARQAGLAFEAEVVKKAGVGSFAELDATTRQQVATRQSKVMIAAQTGQQFGLEIQGLTQQTSNMRGGSSGGSSGGGGAGMSHDAKVARFHALAAKGKKRKPSENTEYNALSKELDMAKPGSGGSKPKRELSAYEQTVEGEIDRLAKEAGQRAGIKAGVGKEGRAKSYAAAKQAEEATRAQLRERVDSGMPLPGQFHNSLLASAGFNDVANRGTPPPVAVSIVKVEPLQVTVSFTGPVSGDPREMREMISQVFDEELPQELAAGIREAKLPIVY